MVLVIGGSNLDLIARTQLRPALETSNPGSTRHTPGGVARNVAENLGRLDVACSLITSYADDAAGQVVHDSLLGLPVTTRRLSAAQTGTYAAVLDDGGDLVIGVADMAATDSISPDQIDPIWFDDQDWVVIDGNLRIDTIERCLDLSRTACANALLDPVSVAKAVRLRSLSPLPLHTFTPNHDELLAFADTDQVNSALRFAFDRGVERVWLREGRDGSVLHHHDGTRVEIAADHTDAVADVTGAGDAMLAAYLHRILRGDLPTTAATYAARGARLTVEVVGAVNPDLTPHLLEHA